MKPATVFRTDANDPTGQAGTRAAARSRVRGPRVGRLHALAATLALALALLAPAVASQAESELPVRFTRQYSEILLDLQVTGDAGAAADALDVLLGPVLFEPTFEGQLDLAEAIVLARAQAWVDAGDAPRALRSLEALSFSAPGVVALGEVDLLPRWNVVAARSAVRKLRDHLASSAPQRDDAGEEIAAVVADALAKGAERTLTDLGARAIPALIDQRDPGARVMQTSSADAYRWLAEFDAERALSLTRADLESGALCRPGRAARVLRYATGQHWRELVLMTEGRPGRIVSEDMRALCLALAADVDLWSAKRADDGSADLQSAFGSLANADALEPQLAQVLGHTLRELPGERALAVLRDLASNRLQPSLRPTHEAVLDHDDDLVRRFAAGKLADLPSAGALLGRVTDPDPAVRELLATWFVRRNVWVPDYRTNGVGQRWEEHHPVVSEEARGVLARLCGDPSRGVRQMAVLGLVEGLDEPLDAVVYERLAADPDARVRATLAELRLPDEAFLDELLLRLAGDTDPGVRLALASRTELPGQRSSMSDVPSVGSLVRAELPLPPAVRRSLLEALARDSDPAVRERVAGVAAQPNGPELLRDVLLALAADPDPAVRAQIAWLRPGELTTRLDVLERLAGDADREVLKAVDVNLELLLRDEGWLRERSRVEALLTRRRFDPRLPAVNRTPFQPTQSAEGWRLALRWALREGSDDAWEWVLLAFPTEERGGMTSYLIDRFRVALRGLDDDELGEVAVETLARRRWAYRSVAFVLMPLPPEREELARALFARRGESHELALLGAQALARASRPDDLARLAGFLRELDDDATVERNELRDDLRSLLRNLPDERCNAFLAERLADDTLGDEFRLLCAESLRAGAPGDVALAEAIVARWFTPDGERLSPVVEALDLILATAPERLDQAWLGGALDTRYGRPLLFELTRRKAPGSIPLLGEALGRSEALAGSWNVNGTTETSSAAYVSGWLVDGLVSYLSDEAAEQLLLAASKARWSSHRDLIMDGVRRIQEYQDARATWERRFADRATRVGAVAELLELLTDDDPLMRTEAARGLATLRAVEHLPSLVRLLKDDDDSVRASARAALDRLHALADADEQG